MNLATGSHFSWATMMASSYEEAEINEARPIVLTVLRRPCYKKRSVMLSSLQTRIGTRSRLIRGIALLFLVYTAIDIAAPNLCRGETLGDGQRLIAVDTPKSTGNVGSPVARIETSDQQPTRDPSDQPHDDDDCFCCCSHVLPGTVTAMVAVSDLRSPVTFVEYFSVSSPPLAREFHPPRFA